MFAHHFQRTLTNINISMPTRARRVSTRRWSGVKFVRIISICTPRRYRHWARRLTSHAIQWARTSCVRLRKNDLRPTRPNRPLTITQDSVEILRNSHPTMIITWGRELIRPWFLERARSTSSGTSPSRQHRSKRSKSSSIRLQQTAVKRRRSCTTVVLTSLLRQRTACWMRIQSVRTRKA